MRHCCLVRACVTTVVFSVHYELFAAGWRLLLLLLFSRLYSASSFSFSLLLFHAELSDVKRQNVAYHCRDTLTRLPLSVTPTADIHLFIEP